jgi:hypothetical protein
VCLLFVAMDSKKEFLRGCISGDVERVRQLLAEGVDINTRNEVCVFNEQVF